LNTDNAVVWVTQKILLLYDLSARFTKSLGEIKQQIKELDFFWYRQTCNVGRL